MEKFLKGLKWFFHSYIWLFVLGILTDIISKNIIVNNMEPGQSVPLIKGFLHITYSVNNAAAFSMGTSNPVANLIMYSCIAGIASIAIIVYYAKAHKKMHALLKASLMLILAGALGNLVDRLFYTPEYLGPGITDRGVVDFIDFCGIWHAIFNIADSCICIGAAIMLLYFIIDEVKERKKHSEPKVKQEKVLSKTEKEMQNQENESK